MNEVSKLIDGSITEVEFDNTVTSIGFGAFYNCTGLTSVTIPSWITSIDSYAFKGCAKLATDLSFIAGTGVTTLNKYVFAEMWYNDNGTYKGLTTANIPEGITTINDNAFYHSFCITSISIPSTVTSITSYALKTSSYDYDNLVSMTVDANNATYDSRNNCNAVIHTSTNTLVAGCKTTVIPNTVTSIGDEAFIDCTGLTNIDIPNSVTTIGNRAFSGCTGLASVELPNSVTSIGSGAFYTSTLRNVTVQSTVPATITSGVFNTTNLSAIIVPDGTLSAYETAWSDYKDFLFENGVAKWVEQSYTCELDANDTKTGMITVTEKDTNPTSSTYNQTRTRTYEDLTRCNPNQGFTKITSLADATTGIYLVVDEASGKALNASLIKTTTSTSTGLNSSNNLIDVTIENGFIEANETTLNAALVYNAENYVLGWQDDMDNPTESYFIDYSGSGVRFITNTTGTKYSNCPKEVNGRFTFGNFTRSLGKPSTTYIKWYETSANSRYFTGMALYKYG